MKEPIKLKNLRSLPKNWEAKVTAIQEAKDLKVLSLDELMGSLMTHEVTMRNHQEETKPKKSLALKHETGLGLPVGNVVVDGVVVVNGVVVDSVSQSRLGVCAADLGLGWWVCAADLFLDPRAQELHDSPALMETQNHLHRDPLRLGLCRGSPT
uniref:UBN2 domain-containing protein n=1 Tax=Fagus sylvatica TaxID=28930 RepID=A0A2N9FE41_FAGSY